jgi:hypothetical protein
MQGTVILSLPKDLGPFGNLQILRQAQDDKPVLWRKTDVIRKGSLRESMGPLKKNKTTDYADCTDGKGEQWTQSGFEPSPSFSYQDVVLHLNSWF